MPCSISDRILDVLFNADWRKWCNPGMCCYLSNICATTYQEPACQLQCGSISLTWSNAAAAIVLKPLRRIYVDVPPRWYSYLSCSLCPPRTHLDDTNELTTAKGVPSYTVCSYSMYIAGLGLHTGYISSTNSQRSGVQLLQI